MADEPVGQVEETSHHTYTPIFISYGEYGSHNHSLPRNVCPYCESTGIFTDQSTQPFRGQVSFYCPMCELTWKYKVDRKGG